MRTLTLTLVLVLLSALLGCARSSESQSQSPPGTTINSAGSLETMTSGSTSPMTTEQMKSASTCRADKFMRFPPLMPSTDLLTCQKDSDCVISNTVTGSCCDHGCNQRWVYTQKLLESLKDRQRECCNGIKLDCPLYRCPRNRFEYEARCVAHRCSKITKPAAWTLKK
ncbi:hypothetical protein KKF84_11600 [Myxococcota bacterium]|nr:hypothetical protein [Myxococcota bacterium]